MEKKQNPREEDEETRDRLIVLLRHGIAEDRGEGKPDEERALTPEGHARMMKIAAGIEFAVPKAQAIVSSPLVRAMQTALWVSKAYRSRIKVKQSEALAPAGTHEQFLELIRSVPERRIILVGHEPNLTRNATALLALTNDRCGLELKKGGCYGIRLGGETAAVLEWALSPRILRKLAE